MEDYNPISLLRHTNNTSPFGRINWKFNSPFSFSHVFYFEYSTSYNTLSFNNSTTKSVDIVEDVEE